MSAVRLSLPEVYSFWPNIVRDDRGRVIEAYCTDLMDGFEGERGFRQSEVAFSVPWTLRGIEYQVEQPQGVLIRCIQGEAYAVAVDMRENSTRVGKWCGLALLDRDCVAMWVPPGFAWGVLSLAVGAAVVYEYTASRTKQYHRRLLWNDPELAIRWPLGIKRSSPLLSNEDRGAPVFGKAELISVAALAA